MALKKFIDIGANLTDLMYSGIYNGSQKHEPDLQHVLKRAWDSNVKKIIVTGGNAEESQKAINLAKSDENIFATVGVHPTRCLEFETSGDSPEGYRQKLADLVISNKDKVVALGECGLDYDRVQFCPKEVQQKYFGYQLELNTTLNLPLFLHCRNAAEDLYNILSKYKFKGVVHSFDGTIEEAEKFIKLGYYIGLNGCSLKTEDNLKTIKDLPSDRILLETDCPWCEIRPTHAGYKYISKENVYLSVKKEKWNKDQMVKSRNEPSNIRQVLNIISAVRNENEDNLSEIIYNNTNKLFFTN